jgi:capping protein beta
MSENKEPQQLEAALDLMRRMPPSMLSENLDILTQLVPDIADDILQNQDCPLQVRKCKKTGKDYIICEYNRDGDSYR